MFHNLKLSHFVSKLYSLSLDLPYKQVIKYTKEKKFSSGMA